MSDVVERKKCRNIWVVHHRRELPKTCEVEDQLLYGLKICRILFAGLLAGFKLVFQVRTQQDCFDAIQSFFSFQIINFVIF